MGFLEGWKTGEDIDRNRERSAWEQEKQAQEREQWEREKTARTESQRLMDEAMRQRQTPGALDETWLNQYGLTPQAQRPPVEQSAYGMRSGFAPAQSAPPVEGRFEAPVEPAPRQPAPVNPAWQRASTMAGLARANGDYNGFLNAQKTLDDVDNGGKVAQLHSAVMAAPPEKIASFAKTYSDNSTAPGKLTTGKNGLMTLTLDGGEAIQMNRVQVAQYVTGLYKMQQGDSTGLNDVAGVHEKLALATKDMWGKLKDVGALNSDTALKSNQMSNDNQRTANDGARVGLAKTAAGRPNYVQMVDAEGNAQMVNANALPETGGVLQVPKGMRFATQRPQVDLQAVERRATALEGKPMAGASRSGTPRLYDADTAYQAAMQQLYPQQAGQQPGGLPGWGEKQGQGRGQPVAPQETQAPPPSQGTYRVVSQMGPDNAYVLLSTGEMRNMSMKQLAEYGFRPE